MVKLILTTLLLALPCLAQTQSELELLLDRIDTTDLQTPVTALPGSVFLPYASSGIQDLAGFASVMGEPLEAQTTHRATDYLRGSTDTWELELYPSNGTFAAIEKEALWTPRYAGWLASPPRPADKSELEGRALALLADLGLMSDEIGEVATHELHVMTEDATGGHTSRLHGYIVAVDRAYADVPVAGSFAVVGFNMDGSLHKVQGTWPRQAASGHRLDPVLDAAGTARLVAEALLAENRAPDGPIALSYLYDTRMTAAGTQMMELKVVADFLDTPDGEKAQAPTFSLTGGAD